MDAKRPTTGAGAAAAATGDRQTFQNVRGDDLWTLVCLGGKGGYRILRNGVPFTLWAAGDVTAAMRAYQGLTGRWAATPPERPDAVPPGAAREAAGDRAGRVAPDNQGRAMRGTIAGAYRALFVGSDGRDVLAYVRRPDGGFALLRNGTPVGTWGDADRSAGLRAYQAMTEDAPPPVPPRPRSHPMAAAAIGPH